MAANDQIDLEEGRRTEVDALYARLATANHFEVLGVPAGAGPEDVRKAFYELSRKFHPDRYYGKKLGPYAAKLDAIFKRLADAHGVLCDAEKRQAYLDANPVVRAKARASGSHPALTPEAARPKTADEEARDAERRARMAKHPYLAKVTRVQELVHRAKEYMAKQEYSHAFTQLNLASQVDPTAADVKLLLGEVRRKNDALRSETDYKRGLELLERGDDEGGFQALRTAVSANPQNAPAAARLAALLDRRGADPKESSGYAQKAVESEPTNVEYRLLLARLLDAGNMKALAKRHFDEAVRLQPDHPEVKKHVKKRWPF